MDMMLTAAYAVGALGVVFGCVAIVDEMHKNNARSEQVRPTAKCSPLVFQQHTSSQLAGKWTAHVIVDPVETPLQAQIDSRRESISAVMALPSLQM